MSFPLTVSSLPAGEIPCTTSTTPLTLSECSKRPNAVWDPVNSVCHCCANDGSYYVDTTKTSAPCTACKDKTCGNPKYCKGTLVNANAICEENLTTKVWSVVCRDNGNCGGECSGACGSREWYAFSQCNLLDGVYTCTTSFSQWKSWLFYILIILFIIILCLLIYYTTKSWAKSAVTSVAFAQTPTGGLISVPMEGTDVVAVTPSTT